MSSQIKNKVVLITGASEGIGAACAQRLKRMGAKLSLTGIRGPEFEDFSDSEEVISAGDITVDAFRRALFQRTMERFGRIDILINNAGVALFSAPSTVDIDLSRRLFEVNAFAPLALTQLIIPQMRLRRNGTIVNVGSLGGSVSFPWASMYCASKFALHAINDALRRELSGCGIRIIRVCFGPVSTRFGEHALAGAPPERVTDLRRLVSISPDQAAHAIIRAIETGRPIAYVPATARAFMALDFFSRLAMDWYLRRQW